MENQRYNEVDHKTINTMDEIDKIVKNELKLDKKRNAAFKRGMVSATAMSVLTRIIIIGISVIIVAAIIFASLMVLSYWSSVYKRNEIVLNDMKEQPTNNE